MNWKKFLYVLVLIILTIFSIWSYFRNIPSEIFNWNLDSENIKQSKIYFGAFPALAEVYKTKETVFNINEIKNINDKSDYDKKLRSKLTELMQIPFTPLINPERDVLEQIDKGKYFQKKIRLYTSHLTFTYGYLLVPKDIKFPAPGIIAMHQHGGFYENGKEEVVGNKGNPDLFYGKELAERGYVVFVIDSPLFGENSETTTENSRNVSEQFSVQTALNLGYSPLGIILQEDISALNYLYNLNNIDKNNIGCIGHSFGGVRCMYLSALDNRIKATVISSSVANLKPNYNTGILHTWLTLLPGASRYTETNGILGLITPRPLMIFYTEKDPIFPLNEVKEQIESLKLLYERLNQEFYFESILILNEAHAFPKEYHETAYKFLDKYLKSN